MDKLDRVGLGSVAARWRIFGARLWDRVEPPLDVSDGAAVPVGQSLEPGPFAALEAPEMRGGVDRDAESGPFGLQPCLQPRSLRVTTAAAAAVEVRSA